MSRKQFEKIDTQIQKDLRKTVINLRKSYEDRLDEMRAYLRTVYDKYGDGSSLPYAKLAQRLKNTQKEVETISTGLYADLFRDVTDDLKQVYTYSFGATKAILEVESGIKINNTLQLDVLQKAMKSPVGGLTIDLRFERYEQEIASRIMQSIITSSSQGRDFAGAVDDLAKTFGNNSSRIQTIVRTEGHRLMEQAKYDEAKEAEEQDGVRSFKTWITTGLPNVRDTHAAIDGMTIPIDELFPTGGLTPGTSGDPAEDINCYCILEYTVQK
jgi:hypothetical protein